MRLRAASDPMPRRLLIVDDSCDLGRLEARELARYSDLVTLCWLSPATLERLRQGGRLRCHGLREVVGSLERWDRLAIALMRRVCDRGPLYRGLPWRSLLAEALFREARLVQAVIDADALCRRIAGGHAAACDLRVAPATACLFHGLRAAPQRSGEEPIPPRAGLGGRLARRFRRLLLTGGLRAQIWNLLDQLDATYRWRCTAGGRRRPTCEPGGVTLFSSYLNNSRILRAIEPHLPDPIHWIVTNYAGRAGAAGHRGSLHWIWRFAADDPGPAERGAGPPDGGSPAGSRDRALRAWLGASPTWSYWRRTGRFSLPRLTAAWQSYLDLARPRLVVVANQWGLEGWFTELARQRGIPVLQLLHGILDGEFYTGRVLSDALVVWGEFWRDLWPESERPRIHVANPPSAFPAVERRPSSGPPRLTYFSWPLDRAPFYSESELQDGFIEIFHRLLKRQDCRLTVRAHPLENPADLIGRWRRRYGNLPARLAVSQRQPLADVLAQTDVAILYRSTVMLDCFASGIPMIVPRWLEFTWRRRLEPIGGLHLAADFDDLLESLLAWLRDPPSMDRRQCRSFLQPADRGSGDLGTLVSDLMKRG